MKWTTQEIALLRDHYGKLSARAVARKLQRSSSSIYQQAARMGLSQRRPDIYGAEFTNFIRAKNALGWSDSSIAEAWGKIHSTPVNRHTIGSRRAELNLPCNKTSQHQRDKCANRTRQQCAAAGVQSLAEIRSQQFKRYACNNGWPADFPPRCVQIMNAIYEQGPMTRREMCDSIGARWNGSRRTFKAKLPGQSYPAFLARRGFLTRIRKGRRITGQGKGRSCDLYVIPLNIKRGEPDTWPKNQNAPTA